MVQKILQNKLKLMNYIDPDNCSICVIGLGYVGLPLLISISKNKNSFKTQNSINRKIFGFDKNTKRIEELKKNIDKTNEVKKEVLLKAKNITFTSDKEILSEIDIFIVAIPTPIDQFKKPDLSYLKNACITIGKSIKNRNSELSPIIIFESTVYPGCTEEECVPLLEEYSGKDHNSNNIKNTFFCGYSPERINPGDKENNIENIIKVVSGCNDKVTTIVDLFYSSFVKAGTHKTESIKVAEAAKIIENTQRDINIALVNELAIIFKLLKIDTLDVLKAASTKWNFLPFKPGLVGGHCIGVDPYYLTYKSQSVGYSPEVVLAGRKINDGMAKWIVDQLILEMCRKDISIKSANILILGFSFKENCPDIRNTKVLDIVKNLAEFSIDIDIVDPWVDKASVKKKYNLNIFEKVIKGKKYNAVISSVAHKQFLSMSLNEWKDLIKENGILYDLKGLIPRKLETLRI